TIGDFDAALDLIAAIADARSNIKDPLLREVVKVVEPGDISTGRVDPAIALPVLKRVAEIAATITYEVPKAVTQMSLAPAQGRAAQAGCRGSGESRRCGRRGGDGRADRQPLRASPCVPGHRRGPRPARRPPGRG